MISHFIYTVVRCALLGEAGNALWFSHVGTAIGGAGILMNNGYLVSLALVALLESQGLWVVDVTWKLLDS